jgi:hypothetical protein
MTKTLLRRLKAVTAACRLNSSGGNTRGWRSKALRISYEKQFQKARFRGIILARDITPDAEMALNSEVL